MLKDITHMARKDCIFRINFIRL